MFFLLSSLSRTKFISECYVCRCSVKFSLTGRDGDSNRIPIQLEGYSQHSPKHPLPESQRVTFGTTQESRLRSAPHSQGYHSAREVRNFNSPAFGLTPMVPRTPHFLRQCALYTCRSSGLSHTTRLRGRNELSGQLSVRHAFNMTRGRTTVGPQLPQTELLQPCKTPPGLNQFYQVPSTIAHIDHRDLTQPYIAQVTGDHPTSTD